MTGKHRKPEAEDKKPEPRRHENIALPNRPNASPDGWGQPESDDRGDRFSNPGSAK